MSGYIPKSRNFNNIAVDQIRGARFTGGAITGNITLTAADSGTTFGITQSDDAFQIIMPTGAIDGLTFRFVITGESGSGNVLIFLTLKS